MAAQLYNKPEHRHTLIGNWQEEQKLLETTGTHRYKPWVQSDAASQVYSPRRDKPEQLRTFERVLAHTERAEPKDWASQAQATYRNGEQSAHEPAIYTPIAPAGLRTQMEMDAMLAMACIEPEPLPPLPQFKTTNREEFQYLGLSLSKRGQRVMKTQDGTLDVQRDNTFLAESGMLPKAQADRLASGSLARSLPPAFRDADVPVSIYSEAALQGQYGGSVYGSRIVGPSIFARNSDFSKPISEYSKIMDADALPMAAECLT